MSNAPFDRDLRARPRSETDAPGDQAI